MKLKNIPLKKSFPLIFYISLALLFSFLLIQNTSLKAKLKDSNNKTNINSKQLSDQLAKKEEEVNLCIQDRAKVIETAKKPYSFQEFGVYSPDFENKIIKINTYEYKRNKIIRKSIHSDENPGQDWGIDVWELDSYSYILPSLEGYTAYGSQNDFPIFDGYENYGTPRWISERMQQWKEQESYTNKNDLKMYLSYGYGPSYVGSVHYEFYIPNTPSGHQAFVVLWNGVKNYTFDKSFNVVNDPFVIEAKEELMKIADNINIRLPQ